MMKKLEFNHKLTMLLLILAVFCGGCGSGGGNGSIPPPPNPNSIPNVDLITPPPGFINDGSSTSGIYVNAATAQIAVPSINGYQRITIPQSLAQEIAASLSKAKSFLQHNILFQITAQNVYWIDLSGISSKISIKNFTANVTNGFGIGNANIYPLAVGNTSVVNLNNQYFTYSIIKNNATGVVNYNTPTNPNGTFAISDSDPAGVCNVANQKITAVQTAIFDKVAFLGIGTENGTVCIDNLDQSTGLPISGNWQNLSEKATKKVGPGSYVPNPITSFGFYSVGNNILSYWSLTAPTTGIISTYRVTGTFNGTDAGIPSNYLPQGFINLGVSQPQALLNGIPSVQINYIPEAMSTNPAISMVNKDGTLCTVIGTGYNSTKLQVYTFMASGSTNWSNATQFLSGDSGFGSIGVQYGIDDQCMVLTSNGNTYSIVPAK